MFERLSEKSRDFLGLMLILLDSPWPGLLNKTFFRVVIAGHFFADLYEFEYDN